MPNPSFEEGWYNQDGVSELQLPNQWFFEWDGGTNPFVAPPDDYFLRPETRVLPADALPPHERPLFVWDGWYTVKIFKGYWAINVALMTEVYLEPGTYLFEINIFPDLVNGYTSDGQKIWAPDPYSGEVRFVNSLGGSDWFLPTFGQRNTFTHTFAVNKGQVIRLGAGFRNRYGLMNNGWFMDNWSLRRFSDS